MVDALAKLCENEITETSNEQVLADASGDIASAPTLQDRMQNWGSD